MTTIELIDTHIHLDDIRFDEDREQVIGNAADSGIQTMVVPATTRRSWQKILSIVEQYSNVKPAFGLHPLFMDEHIDTDLPELETLAGQSGCIAIGECGLDRYCLKQSTQTAAKAGVHSVPHTLPAPSKLFERQVFYFEAQLQIAANLGLPVIVHARMAVEDVILSIKSTAVTQGVVHSFNGSLQQAKQLIDLGYRLSFGGAATYPRAKKIRRLIQSLPIESILIETDAPDQSGLANQGRRNEPAYLPEVLQTIASLQGKTPEATADQCNQNATKLFRIDA